MKRKFILFFSFSIIILSGCVEEPCYENRKAGIQFNMYSSSGNGFKDTTLKSFRIIEESLGLDTIYSNKHQISLPVFPSVEEANLKILTHANLYYDCDSTMEIIETMVDRELTYDTIYKVDVGTCRLTTAITDRDSLLEVYYVHQVDIAYKLKPVLINYDCGVILGLESLTATLESPNFIDSIKVVSTSVTNESIENIQVFF